MEAIAPGIHQLDTRLGGWERLTAGFLVEGEQPALVETGARTSAATVSQALAEVGLGPADLRWLVLTHIHLDHAGGIGDLAAAFPGATVVVHELGAPHLVDPTRLVASSARVYGELLDTLYGTMAPVPAERIVAAADGLELDVGAGRKLRMIESPGHARHHHAVLDEQTGTLLVGDAVGVRLPDVGILRPAAPPPEFDLEAAVTSLRKFAALRPQQLVLTHYGPVLDPPATLSEAEDLLHRWVAVAERVMREQGGDASVDAVAAALQAEVGIPDEQIPAEIRERVEALSGIHSNAAGIHRYLKKRAEVLPG